MNILESFITLFIAGVMTIGGLFGVQPSNSFLGATIATTSQSDTIGTFRTNVNTSLQNLNTQLNTVSSTVSGFGNITSENVPLAVNKGGTGTSTTPSEGKFFVSNGTIPTWKTATFGGGLTYTTTTTGFTLNTTGIDVTVPYAWTGGHTHSASSTFNGGLYSTATTSITGVTTLGTASVTTGNISTLNATTSNFSATSTFNGNISFATSSTVYTNAILWQYLGTNSTTTSIMSPSSANAAIVHLEVGNSNTSAAPACKGEVTIFRVGKTFGSIRCGDGGNTADYSDAYVAWMASSTVDFSYTSNGTAEDQVGVIYWYK